MRAHRKGEVRERGRRLASAPWRNGLWSITRGDRDAEGPAHFEDHLNYLLDLLEPVKTVIGQLMDDYALTAEFWCGYFMEQVNSSFGISPRTLARMAALKATFALDIYAPPEGTPGVDFIVKPDEAQ